MGALIHWGYFIFFLREQPMFWPLNISVVFRRLVRLGSFPACWRQVNVTIIPKSQPSFSVVNYLPISIASVFKGVQYSKVCLSSWCRFASDDLWNAVVCFQPPSLLIGKVLVPVMHFVCVAYTAKCIGEWAGG